MLGKKGTARLRTPAVATFFGYFGHVGNVMIVQKPPFISDFHLKVHDSQEVVNKVRPQRYENSSRLQREEA